MVKEFLHILRTYLITFRYLKKGEIFNFVFFILVTVGVFVWSNLIGVFF